MLDWLVSIRTLNWSQAVPRLDLEVIPLGKSRCQWYGFSCCWCLATTGLCLIQVPSLIQVCHALKAKTSFQQWSQSQNLLMLSRAITLEEFSLGHYLPVPNMSSRLQLANALKAEIIFYHEPKHNIPDNALTNLYIRLLYRLRLVKQTAELSRLSNSSDYKDISSSFSQLNFF